MAGSFQPVLDRYSWALHQIAVLDSAITEYVNEKPYVTAIKDDPEAQGYRVIAHLRKPPPTDIAHIVGDCLANLQGTLDYLAAELVRRENGVPDSVTAFPIKKPNGDGSEPWVNIPCVGEKRGHVAAIQNSDVINRLKDVQPSKNGDRWAEHPLWLLRKLNGESKHRHPALVTAAIWAGHYTYPTAELPGLGSGMGLSVNFTPLKDGDQMAFVPYPFVPKDGLPEKDEFTVLVSVEGIERNPGTGDPMTAVDAMADLAAFIGDTVIPPFEPLFPSAQFVPRLLEP